MRLGVRAGNEAGNETGKSSGVWERGYQCLKLKRAHATVYSTSTV